MIITSNIAIIIPAAGASRRMGAPKQLLPWGKTTLLGHAVTQALRSDAEEAFVVLGAHETLIKKEMAQHPVTVLKNENWEAGLGTSIACGVQHLLKINPAVNGVLIMLADQPLIDYQYLNTLISNFQSHQNKIIATSYGKRAGVPAVFGKPYFKVLSGLEDDHGAKYLMEKHSHHVIALDAGKKLTDIDTLEDYRELHHKS